MRGCQDVSTDMFLDSRLDIGDYQKHFSVCVYVVSSFNDGIDVGVVSEMTFTKATSDHLQISS